MAQKVKDEATSGIMLPHTTSIFNSVWDLDRTPTLCQISIQVPLCTIQPLLPANLHSAVADLSHTPPTIYT